MKRSEFIKTLQVGLLGTALMPSFCFSKSVAKKYTQCNLKMLQNSHNLSLPEENRIPFGWEAIGIAPGGAVKLLPDGNLEGEHFFIRVSVAQEIWEEKLLHVIIPEVGIHCGTIDIRYSSVLVPYQLKLKSENIKLIEKYGIELRLESKLPLWIFDVNPEPDLAFSPHILTSCCETGTIEDFLNCFISKNSLQAFGWREGTVLDGLWQIYSMKNNFAALNAIKQHFNLYFDTANNLKYETSRSIPNDNSIDGIESTIPFATLARINPDHPILKTVIEGWEKMRQANGMIIDYNMVSAEGCYTVAYPLAVIGKIWKNEKLLKDAITQLKHRFVLIEDNKLYLRFHLSGQYTYPNWARGAAWNLLGFARTINELKDEIWDKEIIDIFRNGVKVALSMQRKDGLWSCFMDNPQSLPDTSGSAGIAAAILTGIQLGILPDSYRKNAEKCWNSLQEYITPDGFLTGVAQDNRGGEKLQESDYRVIAQMGMGMMAQLYASI